jgi:Tol biopolymer transport system component
VSKCLWCVAAPVAALALVAIAPSARSVYGQGSSMPAQRGEIAYVLERLHGKYGSWLAVTDLAGGAVRSLTKPVALSQDRQDVQPEWSPNGAQVAFVRTLSSRGDRDALSVADVASGRIHPIASAKQVGGGIENPLWSPRGNRLAFDRGYCGTRPRDIGLYEVDNHGSSVTRLPTPPAGPSNRRLGRHFVAFVPLAWAPDGNTLLYLKRNYTDDCRYGYEDRSGLYRIGSNGRARTLLARSSPFVESGSWSSDGGQIAFSGGCEDTCQIFRVPAKGGTKRQVTRFPSDFDVEGGAITSHIFLSVAWLAHSSEIAYGRDRSVFAFNVHTGHTRRIAYGSAWVGQACLNPPFPDKCYGNTTDVLAVSSDGKQIAFEIVQDPGGETSPRALYLAKTDGSRVRQIPLPRPPRGVAIGELAVHLR